MSNYGRFLGGVATLAGREKQTHESEVDRPRNVANAFIGRRWARAAGLLVGFMLIGRWGFHVGLVTAFGYLLVLSWKWRKEAEFAEIRKRRAVTRHEQRGAIIELLVRLVLWALPAFLYLNLVIPEINGYLPAPTWGIDHASRETLLSFFVPPGVRWLVVPVWAVLMVGLAKLLIGKAKEPDVLGSIFVCLGLFAVPTATWLAFTAHWPGVQADWRLPGWVTPLRFAAPVVGIWAARKPEKALEWNRLIDSIMGLSNLLDSLAFGQSDPGSLETPFGDRFPAMDKGGEAQASAEVVERLDRLEQLMKQRQWPSEMLPAEDVDQQALEELHEHAV